MEKKGIMKSAETKKLYNFVRGFGYKKRLFKGLELLKSLGTTETFAQLQETLS